MKKAVSKFNLVFSLLMLLDLIYLHTTLQIDSTNIWVLYLITISSLFVSILDIFFDSSANVNKCKIYNF
jgi:hypothetical protein